MVVGLRQIRRKQTFWNASDAASQSLATVGAREPPIWSPPKSCDHATAAMQNERSGVEKLQPFHTPERPYELLHQFLISWMTTPWFGMPTVLQTPTPQSWTCAHVPRPAEIWRAWGTDNENPARLETTASAGDQLGTARLPCHRAAKSRSILLLLRFLCNIGLAVSVSILGDGDEYFRHSQWRHMRELRDIGQIS